MNRRELLKFSLLAPFASLFKSRKSGASTGLTETTGTSSEGRFFYLRLRDGHPLEGNKEVAKYLDDVTTYLHNTYPVEELLNDPMLCPTDTERIMLVKT